MTVNVISISGGKDSTALALLAIEEIHEYNPNAWNDSRKVKPPRNVLFRANIHRKGFAGEEWVKHRCILHDGYAWKEVDNFKPWGEIIKLDFDEWIEFRPWED